MSASPTLRSAAEVDKTGPAIREMFAGVAPRYDLLNHLLSASLDRLWRRRAAAALAPAAGSPVLDLCAGTGDQAIALFHRGARVYAADFCLPMLALGERKFRRLRARAPARPRGVAADALRLPFRDRSFSGLTVAFGLRNLADLPAGLAEIARLLAPGGRLVALEFAVPERPLLRRLYLFYLLHLLPVVGRLLSPRAAAYRYLPASVLPFPQRGDLTARLAAAGFTAAAWRELSGGIVCLYTAVRP